MVELVDPKLIYSYCNSKHKKVYHKNNRNKKQQTDIYYSLFIIMIMITVFLLLCNIVLKLPTLKEL